MAVATLFALQTPIIALAQGTVTGHCRFEQVKGQPGSYFPLYEWNIYAVIDGGTAWGHYFRTWGGGYYTFPNPELATPLPGGTYSIMLDQPLFWGRPRVVSNIPFPASGVLNLNVALPTDYSCAFPDDDFTVWGTSPWDHGTIWYQTFQANGTSITGITIKLADSTASTVRMSIHEDDGGHVTGWPQVGEARVRPTAKGSDIWVRFRSGEVPTMPGRRYALKLDGQGGSLSMFRRQKGSDGGYALGQAFTSLGHPRDYDLYAVILSDSDGTLIPYVSRLDDRGVLTHWEWAWSQEIRAKGRGLAGALVYFAADPWAAPLNFRVRTGGALTSPQIGPTKTGRGASQASSSKHAAATWNPGELNLTPGELYYIEVSGVPGTDSVGLQPYRFNELENVYPDGDAFANGIRQPGVDLLMQVVEYVNIDPPALECSPTLFVRSIARGDSLPSDTFTVANSGGGLIDYTVDESISWLLVGPTRGSTFGPAITHTIHYTTAGLAIGSHSGIITISSHGITPQTVTVNLEVTPPLHAPADFDRDGDVDQEDFAHFQRCLSGSGNPPTPACLNADLDGDGDVDQMDFTLFFGCMSGAGIPADTTCAG